jgi:hypothetical protein
VKPGDPNTLPTSKNMKTRTMMKRMTWTISQKMTSYQESRKESMNGGTPKYLE